MEIPKANLIRFRTFWFLAFIAPAVWFLYWIWYDLVVWNKLLVEVNVVNYIGVLLSVAFLFAGSQIKTVADVKRLLKRTATEQNHMNEQETRSHAVETIPAKSDARPRQTDLLSLLFPPARATTVQQNRTPIWRNPNKTQEQPDAQETEQADEQRTIEKAPFGVLPELEKTKIALMEEKRALIALKERLQRETTEVIDTKTQNIQRLALEIAVLKHQCDELESSLMTRK